MSSDLNNPTQEVSKENNVETTPVALDGDNLMEAIKRQVEFYFSPNNLPADTFLLSKMDDEHFVPISLVASFAKMKALSSDQNIITEALENSQTLELSSDKTKLRPKEEKRRNRLILHHLPEETTEKELKDIFQQGNFTPEIKSDINNCWFVTFSTEDEATGGLEFIKNQQIHDQPIRARLKPEPVLQNIYNPQAGNNPVLQNTFYYPNWTPSMMAYYRDQSGDQRQGYDPTRGRGGYKKYRKGDGNRRYDGNKKRRGQNRKGKRGDRRHTPVQLGPNDFPPLPSTTSTRNMGYSEDFKIHKPQAFIDVIKQLTPTKDENCPQGFPVLDEPITSLETENIQPIESQDLSARSTAPMSERVKKPRGRSVSNKQKRVNKEGKKSSNGKKQNALKSESAKTSQEPETEKEQNKTS